MTTMEVANEKDTYLSRFEELERSGANEPEHLRKTRRAAIARFAELGFPTLRDEEWRFTSVQPVIRSRYISPAAGAKVTADDIAPAVFAGDCHRIVFVDGHFSAALSTPGAAPKGAAVVRLSEAVAAGMPEVEAHLAKHAAFEGHAFAALNTALWQDGTLVSIARGADVGTPIHILHVATPRSEPFVVHPRTLVVAGANSRARIVESFYGLDHLPYFTNSVTEMAVAEDANLDYCKVQMEGGAASHIASIQSRLARGCTASAISISLGAALARNDIGSYLDGENVHATLDGLYLVGGTQHVDHHTRIDHAKANCASREMYKGVLFDQSRGVFNGRIVVHQDAQKTDSKQTNKNLLLSEQALVDTNPQLEIYADDVKCTHGATIGRLNEEAVFYLRSRGIADLEAQAILTRAFAEEMIDRIKIEPLRRQLDSYIAHKTQGRFGEIGSA